MCGRYETQDRIAAACTLEQETVQKMLLRERRQGAILRFPLLALYWQATGADAYVAGPVETQGCSQVRSFFNGKKTLCKQAFYSPHGRQCGLFCHTTTTGI